MDKKIKEKIEKIAITIVSTIIAIPIALIVLPILLGYMIYDLIRLILREIKFIWTLRNHILWNWFHIMSYNKKFP